LHIDQISADEHCRRESRKKIPINVPLHGGVRRPKIVPGGRDFHAFHDWPQTAAEDSRASVIVLASFKEKSGRQVCAAPWGASIREIAARMAANFGKLLIFS
jgi:hypothetical protein